MLLAIDKIINGSSSEFYLKHQVIGALDYILEGRPKKKTRGAHDQED